MEFRRRDYIVETKLCELPRKRVEKHPLQSLSVHNSLRLQVNVVDNNSDGFFDPLRVPDDSATISSIISEDINSTVGLLGESTVALSAKEWSSFTRFLMQKCPVSKMVPITPVSRAVVKGGKAIEKSATSMQREEHDDFDGAMEEGGKFITREEYVARLHELKDEISKAWNAKDHVASLKLSVKVARLLMDTSVLQFYPTLFVLVTDILDMLGDIVKERIKWKAEFSDDGTWLCSLPENFKPSMVRLDAKETCNNWFCKIGAIQELLPRIYLELAILPCWQFLLDRQENCVKRLVMMVRGLADPLASAYCHLYLTRCALKLPSCDTGFLVTCVNDIKTQLMRIVSEKEPTSGNFIDNKALLVSLMEPTIVFLVKYICKDGAQDLGNILLEFGLGRNTGSSQCVSVVLHHLLKELPSDIVTSNAVGILQVIERSNDSSFNQSSTYRLLGLRLCERKPQLDVASAVIDVVIQVVTQYERVDEYLQVIDAYMDIVLQNKMENHLKTILEGIVQQASFRGIAEDELPSLQSILLKLLLHYKHLEDVFALDHCLEILDLLCGNPRTIVSMQILHIAARNGNICNPSTIQLLFEISQALYANVDFVNVKDDDNQAARLISHFIRAVDFGVEMERHLTFLVECRGAFGSVDEIKETLVRSSNCMAIKVLKDKKKHNTLFKSCVAFSEVTLPAISIEIRKSNLYIETAEVALLGGLVSHADGLVDSAISCLHSLDLKDGYLSAADSDGLLFSIQKICGLLVMIPGDPEQGVAYFPRNILSLVNSKLWITSRMRTRVLCATLLLLATHSQIKLPYYPSFVQYAGNDQLFFGDSSYREEVVSLSELILQNLDNTIHQELSQAARGNMALEACNCIASSFKPSPETSAICSKLIQTARSSLSSNNKHLLSTIRYVEANSPTFTQERWPVTV